MDVDYRDPEWVSEKLGIDRNTVYRYLQDGVIPAVQLGRKWLISEKILAEWMEKETLKQTAARREAVETTARTIAAMGDYSRDAREVIRLAHSEARRCQHAYLGQEHLVLAMASRPECLAARALASLGATREKLQAQFDKRFAPGQAVPPRRLARTPRAKEAMRLAAALARTQSSPEIGTQHLLQGLLELGQGAGYDMLAELGVTADGVATAIRDIAESDAGPPQSE